MTLALTLPDGPFGKTWVPVLDTADDELSPDDEPPAVPAGKTRTVTSHSIVVLRRG